MSVISAPSVSTEFTITLNLQQSRAVENPYHPKIIETALDFHPANDIPNNLMPFVAQMTIWQTKTLNIFGKDYPTSHDTSVHDDIHVQDLACDHIYAIQRLEKLLHTGLKPRA